MADKAKHLVTAITVLIIAPLAVFSAVNLPFHDDFETDLSSFTVDDNSGEGAAVLSTAQKISGSQSVSVSNAVLTLEGNANDYTNVWVRFYSKPVAYDDADGSPSVGTNACVFYVNTNSMLKAYSNDTWVTVAADVPVNSWIGLAAQVDYANQTWSLYYETAGVYGSELTRANPKPLAFNTAYNCNLTPDQLVAFAVDSGLQAYVDGMSLSIGSAAVSDSETAKVAVDVLDLASDRGVMRGIPGHTFAAGDDDLASSSALGAYLLGLMNEGDKLYVQDGGTVGVLTKNAEGDWTTSLTPSDIKIRPTTGLWILRDATALTTAFRSYDSTESATNTVVFGADHGASGGWTLLAWPLTASAANTSTTDWGFDGQAENNDRLYIFDEDTGGFKMLYYRNNAWRDGPNAASYQITPGQGFWYQRRSNGNKTWQVETAD